MKSILTTLADEFSQLNSSPIEIGGFIQACRHVSTLLKRLGPGMSLVDKTYYSTQVSAIENAGNAVNTLDDLLDSEIEQNTITSGGSASLVKVKRSLELLQIIFRETAHSSGNSIVDIVEKAYNHVLSSYHGFFDKAAFGTLVPTRSQFFAAVNLDEKSALVQMKKIVKALDHLIDYINNLFNSRKAAKKLLTLP